VSDASQRVHPAQAGGASRAPRATFDVTISIMHMADPACPWAYSALPAITALRWRYREQLDWRVVTIGLAESAEQYERRGYGPAEMAKAPLRFARFGMPFLRGPRPRVMGTGRACRAMSLLASSGKSTATARCERCTSRGSPPISCSTRRRRSLRCSHASLNSTRRRSSLASTIHRSRTSPRPTVRRPALPPAPRRRS